VSSQNSFAVNDIHKINSTSLSSQSNAVANDHLKGRRLSFIENRSGTANNHQEVGLKRDFENDQDDDGVQNLLKEIEQGLDQVCHKKDNESTLRGESGSCPQLTASLTATCAAATSTANNCPHSVPASNNVNEEKKIGSSSLIHPNKCKVNPSLIQPLGTKSDNAINSERHPNAIFTSRDTAKNEMELLRWSSNCGE